MSALVNNFEFLLLLSIHREAFEMILNYPKLGQTVKIWIKLVISHLKLLNTFDRLFMLGILFLFLNDCKSIC